MTARHGSVRVSIFLPLTILLVIGCSAMFWIAKTAQNSHEQANVHQQQVTRALEIVVDSQSSISLFESYINEVTSFDRIISQPEISTTFTALSSDVLTNLEALSAEAEMGVDHEILSALKATARSWVSDAEIILGLRPSSQVPTMEKLTRQRNQIHATMAEVFNQARRFEERAMIESQVRFREHMRAAQISLIILLIAGGVIAFYRANHLASALRRLSSDMTRIRSGHFTFEVNDMTRKDEIGEMARHVSSFARDLQELTATKEHVEYLALHDPLTGLRNRRCMDRKLIEIQSSSITQPEIVALHIDLDRFKIANDTHGHHAGDEILKSIANVLVEAVSQNDLIYRVGGDEFLILSFDHATPEEAKNLAKRILRGAAAPIPYKGTELHVSASIGIAFFSESDFDPDVLLSNADSALYDAKGAGRSRYEFSSKAQRIQRERQRSLLEQLNLGLSRNELTIYFQPQVDVSKNNIIGMETLIRWEHPDRGVLTPAHFLQLAMENGLGDALTELCIEQSIDALKTWHELGLNVPSVGLNLAASQLRNPDLIDELNGKVCNAGLSPKQVSLEIVESVLFGDQEDLAISQVRKLRDLGYKIELDDFGTGHASISNLTHFKVDRIKIDRNFVSGVDVIKDKKTIFAALADLSKNLNIECLAEGVETQSECDALVALGCTQFQGYLFAPPRPLQATTKWLLAKTAFGHHISEAV